MSRIIFLVLLTQSLCNVSEAQVASSVPMGDFKRADDLGTTPDLDDAAIEALGLVEDVDDSSKEVLAMSEDLNENDMDGLALMENLEDSSDLDSGEDAEESEDASKLCGAPEPKWATLGGFPKIPSGWTATNFNGGHNLGSHRGCGEGWSAYANGNRQGQLKSVLRGKGTATVTYGDCWGEGHVGLYINNKQVHRVSDRTKLGSHTFSFADGDEIMFKDEGRNAVINVKSISYQCLELCSTFADKGTCPSRCTWTGSQCSGDCGSIAAPRNGAMGSCKASQPSGSTCSFSCNTGFQVDGGSTCTKGAFKAASCKPLPYVETKYGSNKCPAGFKLIDDEATCFTIGKKMGKRRDAASNWGNIQSGCFSHSNNHIWFNKQKNGRVHGAFSSVCQVQLQPCATFGDQGTCPSDRCAWSQNECKGDCDASAAPANGGVGKCSKVLASGAFCENSCNDGFQLKGESSCSKGVFTPATCEIKLYDVSKRGSNQCPSGYEVIHDKDQCFKVGKIMKKRQDAVHNWGNIQGGCFTHDNNHIWFNVNKNGRVHPHFYSVCRRLLPGCKAVTAPANGNLGDCKNELPSGEKCMPKCDKGFQLSAPSSCFNGKFTVATCNPLKACNVTAPANGGLGDCGSSLASHKTCQPVCFNNYQVTGTSMCIDGRLLAAKCLAPPSCAANKVCSTGKWSLYYNGKSQEECKKMCDDGRKMVPVPDGVNEDMYAFRQNGQFHNVGSRKPTHSRKVGNINYPGTGGHWKGFKVRDHFYVRWSGFIEIKVAGTYTFYTTSDDGSRLYIDGKSVVQNPGWHGMRERNGKVAGMAAGKHPFWTEVFEGGGGAGMIFLYQGPDTAEKKVVVPSDVLSGSEFPTGNVQLNPAWKDVGKCMAYSWNGNGGCIIYNSCSVLAAPGEDQQVCGENMDWALPSTFSTCMYDY